MDKKSKQEDSWNPEQYQKFEKERNQPFFDLVKLILAYSEMNIVDLGCGTGKLTQYLHETLNAKKTLGIDSSSAMLKEASLSNQSNLYFQLLNIEDFRPRETFDLIFSNAAIQWLPNHAELIGQLSQYLSAEGQLAIQIPANFDFPTYTIARDIAKKSPFKGYLEEGRPLYALSIEEYSKLFYHLGFRKQSVRAQVYPHILETTDSVIEWVKGSLLTYYQSSLPQDKYQEFLLKYTEEIKKFFGEQRPFFLPFKRLLLWAQL
jgi:trans-aconitate 2-methyltransferase